MSRRKTWAILSVCTGVIVGLAVVSGVGIWNSRKNLHNPTLRNQRKAAAATEIRADSGGQPVEPPAAISGLFNAGEDFSRPTLRPDPEMFGKPELIPLTPGANVGDLRHPSLPVDLDKTWPQPSMSVSPNGHGDSPSVPTPAWDSPLAPPSAPLSPAFKESGTVGNLAPPSP